MAKIKKINTTENNFLTFKAYKKKELCGPEMLTYQAVQYRIKKGKNIKIVFDQGIKNKRQREMFLSADISTRLKKALDILEKLEKGENEINPINK